MQEGEAQKIDISSMEYYKNIDEKYLDFCKAFDPTNEYAVPYLWGTVGILYNTKVIKEKVDSWSILWDKKLLCKTVCEMRLWFRSNGTAFP